MTGSKIQPRLPEDMKDAAMRQAAVSGIGMNLFVASAIAARVGPRTTPARAKALMARLGTPGALRDGDGLNGEHTAAG